MSREKSNDSEKKRLLKEVAFPEEARKIITENKNLILRSAGKKKYSRTQMVVNEGYDFLENISAVRPYIQAKYNIKIRLLELLLCLYPKQAFTWSDYRNIPKAYTYRTMSKLINEGYIVVFSHGKNKSCHLYCLSQQAKLIVTQYYKHLSGERKIPEDYRNNPLQRERVIKYTKKRMSLIEKMNAMGPSASKRATFE